MHERPESEIREENALFERLLRDHDATARNALVERFLPLSRKLARSRRGGGDIDDLEQVAAIGLVKAIDRFDPARGLAFSTYAVPTILGELKRHFRDRGWSVRVPRAVQELSVRVEQVSIDLMSELGRSPTVAELSRRAGSTDELVLEALEAGSARYAVSLDQPRPGGEDGDLSGHDVAVDDPGYAVVEDAELLDGLMWRLPARDRRVLEMRFKEDRVQSYIAESLGLSQMHVSRVIRNAVEVLRVAAQEPPRPRVWSRSRAG